MYLIQISLAGLHVIKMTFHCLLFQICRILKNFHSLWTKIIQTGKTLCEDKL